MLKSFYLWWKERAFHNLRKQRVEQIFTNIYERNTWGGDPGSYYSGEGTHSPNTRLYIDHVKKFIRDHSLASLLEIGCGDFSIMKHVLADSNVAYLGVDVVDGLIHFHQQNHQTDRIQFKKLNAIEGPLPGADLVIIRQVLQHLSNDHISKILQKLSGFRYALITEHLPVSKDVEYNLDKITGPHIRMKVNSGVFIDKPPFNIPRCKVLFEYPQNDRIKGKEVPAVIRTYLVET